MSKNKKRIISLIFVLIAIIFILIFIWKRYGYKTQKHENSNYAMGTFISQQVYGNKAELAMADASMAISVLENQISWRKDDNGDIFDINTNSGNKEQKVNSYTMELLELSVELAEKTDGAFDPTVLPVSTLWNFDSDTPTVPDISDIDKALPLVNYKDLELNEENSTAFLKNEHQGIDLGSIGKGAACDKAIETYKADGADFGLIAVGGSIGLYGKKPDNSAWNIAVRDPKTSDENMGSIGILSVKNGFISTSGTYEKEFIVDGKEYHHLLNANTGFPEDNELISVTIWCDNGALSDGLSTACYLLGREKGFELAESYNAGIIAVTKDGSVYVSDNLKNSFKLTNTTDYKIAK